MYALRKGKKWRKKQKKKYPYKSRRIKDYPLISSSIIVDIFETDSNK